MRQSSGELADRLQLLRLPELPLGLPPRGDVLHRPGQPQRLARGVELARAGIRDPTHRAIRSHQPILGLKWPRVRRVPALAAASRSWSTSVVPQCHFPATSSGSC
jgi:hypothetical protein